MAAIVSALFYLMVFIFISILLKKKSTPKPKETSSMPHEHKRAGNYDTYNKKKPFNTDGAQPHVHEAKKFTSMSDASKLPPGYILLNGEPVRVADLEGK
jgi:hypothetical protein